MLLVIEQHYNMKPIIYSNRNFIEDYLAEDFPEYTFWIAHYYEQDLNIDECEWKFWQHTDKASLLSTGAKIDANVFKGSIGDLRALLLKDKTPSFRQN
jgi:lysozyme